MLMMHLVQVISEPVDERGLSSYGSSEIIHLWGLLMHYEVNNVIINDAFI